MFGEIADKSEQTSKMHQLVVSRLTTAKQVFWVIHMRSENPMSVYIKDLTTRKVNANGIRIAASAIVDTKTFEDEGEFNRVADTQLCVWGTAPGPGSKTEFANLDTLAHAAKASGMLGYEVLGE